MKKRRIEFAILAALLVLAGVQRPSVELSLPTYQIADFAPQRVEGLRDVGLIAAKLVIAWID